MQISDIITIAVCVLTLVFSIIILVLFLKKNDGSIKDGVINAVRTEIAQQQSSLRQELSSQTQLSVKTMGDMIVENQRSF